METYRRLRELYPAVRAVVCSASLPISTRQPFLDLGVPADCLLAKPCSFAELLAALQGALEDGVAASAD
jgi:CheY-like chemotaxis protein